MSNRRIAGHFARQRQARTAGGQNEGDTGIFTALLFLAATIAAVAVPVQAPNEEAVRATVETYLHGLKFNVVESFRVIDTYPDSTYTDYVSLLKLGDEWKIVNKVFTLEKRAS